MGSVQGLAAGAALCAVLAWLALRRPTALLMIVLATFAVGPQWLLAEGGSPTLLAWAMPAQMLLLLAALLANVAHYGLRLDGVNWPLVAVLWLLCQSLLLADLDPRSRLRRCSGPRSASPSRIAWCTSLWSPGPGCVTRF